MSDPFVTTGTEGQAPLFAGFPQQEYWSGLPFPTPGKLRAQGLNLCLLHWQEGFFFFFFLTTKPPRKPRLILQIRKLRLREMKAVAPSHRADKWWSWDLDLGLCWIPNTQGLSCHSSSLSFTLQLIYLFQVCKVRIFGVVFQMKRMKPRQKSSDLLRGQVVSYVTYMRISC